MKKFIHCVILLFIVLTVNVSNVKGINYTLKNDRNIDELTDGSTITCHYFQKIVVKDNHSWFRPMFDSKMITECYSGTNGNKLDSCNYEYAKKQYLYPDFSFDYTLKFSYSGGVYTYTSYSSPESYSEMVSDNKIKIDNFYSKVLVTYVPPEIVRNETTGKWYTKDGYYDFTLSGKQLPILKVNSSGYGTPVSPGSYDFYRKTYCEGKDYFNDCKDGDYFTDETALCPITYIYVERENDVYYPRLSFQPFLPDVNGADRFCNSDSGSNSDNCEYLVLPNGAYVKGQANDKNESDKNESKLEDKCKVLPEAIKTYLKQALKLIRWGGLVLMIVLGTLDFVKASASDDQDAIKKAGQNFIKRLIAVIILFLLPILVELILFIAGKIGFNFGECYKVSEF